MRSITENKMLAHLDRILIDQRPITADIFLDNYCNNNCSYCTYKRWEFDDDARYMSFEDFKKYAERLRELGVLGFIFSGGGEPSISKDFDKIIKWMDKQGYKWGINTNFVRYFEGKPQYIKVSLDAWDKQSYEEKRGIDAYETVCDNIQRFAKKKEASTQLGIQLIAMSTHDVFRFYEANRDLPVDYIVIRPVESTCGRYYSEYRAEEERPEYIIEAIREIAEDDERVLLNYKWNMLTTRQSSCTAQWAQIAVNEIGEVMYCCHKPFQIVGHIMDENILEKKHLAHTDMNMCDVPCRLTAPNYLVNTIQKSQMNAEFI